MLESSTTANEDEARLAALRQWRAAQVAEEFGVNRHDPTGTGPLIWLVIFIVGLLALIVLTIAGGYALTRDADHWVNWSGWLWVLMAVQVLAAVGVGWLAVRSSRRG